MSEIRRFADLLPGDILTVGPKHPHGPTKARVLRMEQCMGSLKPVCRALDKHGNDEYDETDFFVMSASDVQGVKRP